MKPSKKKAPVYDLSEFYFSKNVVKDFPKIISMYKSLLKVLDAYRHYSITAAPRESILDALELAEIQYNYYEEVNKNKGLMRKESQE